MNYLSTIERVVYSSSSNNYKIFFISGECKLKTYFNIPVSDAKNIVLAKESIHSDRLKTYDLIIDLFSLLSIKIDRFIISKRNNEIFANLFFKINEIEHKVNLSFIDAMILSIKSFSNIYIHKNLYFETNTITTFDDINVNDKTKIVNLKNILKFLIKNEEYESAALIRNKINKINN